MAEKNSGQAGQTETSAANEAASSTANASEIKATGPNTRNYAQPRAAAEES